MSVGDAKRKQRKQPMIYVLCATVKDGHQVQLRLLLSVGLAFRISTISNRICAQGGLVISL